MIHTTPYDEPISPAESTRHSWELESNREAREHDLKVRKQELEVLKIQTRWGVWFQIPILIIKLPLFIVLGLGFIVAMARGIDPGESFWNLLK